MAATLLAGEEYDLEISARAAASIAASQHDFVHGHAGVQGGDALVRAAQRRDHTRRVGRHQSLVCARLAFHMPSEPAKVYEIARDEHGKLAGRPVSHGRRPRDGGRRLIRNPREVGHPTRGSHVDCRAL